MKNDAVEEWIAIEAVKWRNERRVKKIDDLVDRVVKMNRDLGHGTDPKHKARILDE